MPNCSSCRRGTSSLPLALPPCRMCSIIRNSTNRLAFRLSERQARLVSNESGSITKGSLCFFVRLVKHVEPVGIGDGWDMHVDRQTITPKSARQVEGGNLADIVGIVV